MEIVRDNMPRPKISSPKSSRSVRLTDVVIHKAEAIAKVKGHGTLSDLIRSLLIREIEEFERENGTVRIAN